MFCLIVPLVVLDLTKQAHPSSDLLLEHPLHDTVCCGMTGLVESVVVMGVGWATC